MKPTSDDFEPRRDGWFEHKATWQEVVVGTVIASRERRSQRWEIIDVAMSTQVDYGRTLWMRARAQATGVEYTVRPRKKVSPVIILTQDPRDTEAGDPTAPSDADAIMLLVRELGADAMATRDDVTGEITCPDYLYDSHIPRELCEQSTVRSGMIEHMRFAHTLSVNDDLELASAVTLHGQAHHPGWPNIGKGGFPHRHVPEDLSIMK